MLGGLPGVDRSNEGVVGNPRAGGHAAVGWSRAVRIRSRGRSSKLPWVRAYSMCRVPSDVNACMSASL